jgi:hypothetical protein
MDGTSAGKELNENGKIVVDSVYSTGKVRNVMRQAKETVDPITTTKSKQDKVTIEISEKRDTEGNLHVTTLKRIVRPDWTKKTETTTELIPASEVAAYRKKQEQGS